MSKLSKYIKNRFVIAVMAIILAMVICFVLVPGIFNQRGELTELVRVKEQIFEGTVIDADMLETVTVGGYNLPDTVIKKAEDVVGKYALATLEPGDYILAAKVGDEFVGSENYFQTLGDDQYAMSITIYSFAAGLSGKLQVNDVISIVDINAGTKEAKIPDELKYVKVIAVTANTGMEASGEELPATVTVLVNQKQAEILAALDNQLTHFVLVYRGDLEKAKEYLDLQTVFFTGGRIKSETVAVVDEVKEDDEADKEDKEEDKRDSQASSTDNGDVKVTEEEAEDDET